jgi:hypothetical protein
MPRTQINCPNCGQPIAAHVEQLIDVGQEPQIKQALLGGMINTAQCPHCNYQGNLATPIVYHDPEKELLLTFFPPEMNMKLDEQERILGPMITKVVDNLPQEQRKGYLFSPQSMLTHKVLIERILEADGITKEMLQEQEQRMELIQRLLTASEDSRLEMIKQEDEMIDDQFFALFSRLAEASLQGSDQQQAALALRDVQSVLLEHSSMGKKIKVEAEEIQAARQDLEDLGEGLTRENLLDLIVAAPNDTRLKAYVQMTRPGMDYQFFQSLSDLIEQQQGDEKQRLTDLREQLLALTGEIDAVMEQRMDIARKNLETLLQVEDIPGALEANMGAVDEFFVQVLTETLEAAREAGDLDRSSKLQQIMTIIEEQSTAPPEYELIDELVAMADDEEAVRNMLLAQADEVNATVMEIIMGLINQLGAQEEIPAEQREMLDRLQNVYNVALKMSMEKSFKG